METKWVILEALMSGIGTLSAFNVQIRSVKLCGAD
jgi:hypothetical protein